MGSPPSVSAGWKIEANSSPNDQCRCSHVAQGSLGTTLLHWRASERRRAQTASPRSLWPHRGALLSAYAFTHTHRPLSVIKLTKDRKYLAWAARIWTCSTDRISEFYRHWLHITHCLSINPLLMEGQQSCTQWQISINVPWSVGTNRRLRGTNPG